MGRTDDLYMLIRSLTPAEKRAFALHARRHLKEPHYLTLFETLGRQKQYDEDAVRRVFKGTVSARHLAVIRHTLLNEVIGCLQRFPSSASPEATMRSDIDAIAFLLGRGCTGVAERRLRKALQQAQRLELPGIVLELCGLQRRLPDVPSRTLERTLTEERRAIHMLRDTYDALSVLARSATWVAEWYARRTIPSEDCAWIELETRTDDDTVRSSVRTRICRLRIGLRHAIIRNDTERQRHAIRDVAGSLQHAPHLHGTAVLDWTDAIVECNDTAFRLGDGEALRMLAALARTIEAAAMSVDMKQRARVAAIDAECALAILAGINAHAVVDTALREHSDARRALPTAARAAWNVRLATACLMTLRYKDALDLVNDVLSDQAGRTAHPYWHGQTLMVNTITHLALDNRDYVPYCIRSAVRRTERGAALSGADVSLLRTMGRLVRGTGRSLPSIIDDICRQWLESSTDGMHVVIRRLLKEWSTTNMIPNGSSSTHSHQAVA